MKLISNLIAVVGAALIATTAGAQPSAPAPGLTDTEIKIGAHMALSGVASFVGQGGKVGLDLAIAEINAAGGVNGRKLVYTIIDDKASPDGGVAAVRRLVESDNVFLVHGLGTSSSTVPVLPYFRQNAAVPYYISNASDPVITKDFAPNIYTGATLSQRTLAGFIVDFLVKDLKAKNVAMLQCDQAHCISGAPFLKGLLEKEKVNVNLIGFNSGDTDFTGQMFKAKSMNPDVVFLYALPSDSGRLLPQIKRAGITAHIVSEISSADPSVGRVAGKAGEGFYSFWIGGTQFVDDKTGAMAKWYQSLDTHKIERTANTPNLNSLMAYADVYVLAEAMRAAGKNLTREGVIKSLDSMKGFVAGKDAHWKTASPIGLPRNFSTTDHEGNKTAQVVVYRDGVFKPAK